MSQEEQNPALAFALNLEEKARVILGWESGTATPLTAEEREYMRKDAYDCSPAHPPDEAPDDDRALCLWWMQAMKEYVDCL